MKMDFSALSNIINDLTDDCFWEPLQGDDQAIEEFDKHMALIEESQDWDRRLNWKKGRVLEDLAVFLFERFIDSDVMKNKRPGDNETDIETRLSEKILPAFMSENIGQRIICECKNKKTSSIDVGVVTKLAELLPVRGSRFGIFISILGVGGYAWKYGEGKRKKIMCKEGLPIISFTVKELKVLRDGENFLTMIKQKFYSLVDEVDDESADFPQEGNIEYNKRIFEIFEHLKKCEILNDEEEKLFQQRVIERYGPIIND
ncbi:hypothetical protein V8V55_14865 [Priestia megaterium]|uniref:restriction endonuclease n=1 Tax=Priestia megaterium TaxID=1404 RepID=UPI0030099462